METNASTQAQKKAIAHDNDINQVNETQVFDPYNNQNTEITLNNVQSILKTYGVQCDKVFNINLYKRAFIHRSYVKRPHLENVKNDIVIVQKPNDCLSLKTKSNERLEFLGDGVLECITKYYLYRRFPKENEGFMTEKKIALVKNEHIGRLAYEMGLHKWYIISKNAEEKKTRTNFKKLGCLFEAFLGALFLDFNKISVKDDDDWFKNVFVTGPGFQMAQIFVESIFEKHVNWTKLIEEDDNYKNILQVKIQKEFRITPTYMVIDEDDETGYHIGVYIVINIAVQEIQHKNSTSLRDISFPYIHKYVEDNGSCLFLLGESSHKIKKKAEQAACIDILKRII
jgi:dsRNA-specific ribonuclease